MCRPGRLRRRAAVLSLSHQRHWPRAMACLGRQVRRQQGVGAPQDELIHDERQLPAALLRLGHLWDRSHGKAAEEQGDWQGND